MITSELVKEGIIQRTEGNKAEIMVLEDGASFRKNLLDAGRDKVTATFGAHQRVRSGQKVIIVGQLVSPLISWLIMGALPCILVIFGLIIGLMLGFTTLGSCMAALSLFVVYYVWVSAWRNRLNDDIRWQIEDLDN